MNEYQKRLQELGRRKYGTSYNPNLDWYRQTAQALPTWSQIDEEKARLELQALEDYRINTEALQKQNQALQQSATMNKAQLGLDNQLVQKYLGNNLRSLGQNTSGIAESTMAQQGNTYLSNLANINRDTTQNQQNLFDAYINSQKGIERQLNQELNEAQSMYDSSLINQITQELNEVYQSGALNQNTYENVKNKYIQQGLSPNAISQLDQTYSNFINDEKAKSELGVEQGSEGININTMTPNNLPIKVSGPIQPEYQNEYTSKIIQMIQQNPQAYNGKVVSLHFNNDKNTYVIYNGFLYKTSKNAKPDEVFESIRKPIQQNYNKKVEDVESKQFKIALSGF